MDITLFEEKARKFGWNETGDNLVSKIRENLMTDEVAFDIVNAVYMEINGQEIRWDEGLSASNILEMLISEYCGINGRFEHVILLFDEFGRYLEYASGVNAAKSGDSALQQIFETAQNANGVLQVINFIQSDIKTYLQRVDQTKNISRYIGRYDASDKYYISSNLETVFANLIQRKDMYMLEFLDLPEPYKEYDLKKAILKNMKKFLLEFGRDFIFIDEEYHVQVGNNDYYVDLLFYHRELQCLVAIDLKIDDFKPEYMGKMDFYLEALDRDIKKPHENPSVGMILCKNADTDVVEYSLSRSLSQTMIAEYKTKLIDKSILQRKLAELYDIAEEEVKNSQQD